MGEGRDLKGLAGKKIGRYTLVSHLASGGMAEIFLGRNEAAGGFSKDLVLKVLQTRYADHEEVVDMFLGEARLGAMLKHPNLVDVYDVGVEDGLYYIAMEHIAGKTLTDFVRRAIEVQQELPFEYAAFVVAEVAAGLAYMHDAPDPSGRPFSVVHRDISPSNVIVGVSGQTKIIDFGIARQGRAGVKEQSGARPGKVSYMSPEQVKGAAIDGRSDIFSLGTILYEITLGKRLWRGPKEVVMRRIVEENPPPPTYVRRDYPPALELCVLRALEKRPEDRYRSAAELFRDLDAFLVEHGARTRTHDVARYLHDLFSPDAQVSEAGRRRAEAFADGDSGPDPDELDFDRRRGAGAALAQALRAPPTPPPAPVVAAPSNAAAPRAPDSPPAGASPQVGAPAPDVRRSRRTGLVLGIAIVASAAAGLVWVLSSV